MPALFTPFKIKDILLKNRIAAAPMCQYSADDGLINHWHLAHLAGLARGGAGLVVTEAAAISPEGRITPGDAGIWNGAQADAWSAAVKAIQMSGAVPGIQLGHAGRKASTNRPWEGKAHLDHDDPQAWEIMGPSAIALGGETPRVPRAMTLPDIAQVQADFANAAKRARDIGFEFLELHFAHGFLGSSFFSVHANQRADEYGGAAENRGRFLIETVRAVRHVWPDRLPLAVRLGAIEYDGRDDTMLEESIALVRAMKAEGLDVIDVSLGLNTLETNIPWGTPGFLVETAECLRRETGLPTSVSWNITTPEQANALIAEDRVDIVKLAKALLANPHWPYHAARQLGVEQPSSTLPIAYAHWLERYTGT